MPQRITITPVLIRIPIAVQFAFSIIMVVGMIILPETPRYLIKKDDTEGAARSLSRLRQLPIDHPDLIDELAEIQANHSYELSKAARLIWNSSGMRVSGSDS